MLTFERVAVKLDDDALGKRTLESRRDQRAEVGLEIVDLAAAMVVVSGWHQKIDGDLQVAQAPALHRIVAAVVRVRLEPLGAQATADLCLTLLVEQRDRQADVKVIGARVEIIVHLGSHRVDE